LRNELLQTEINVTHMVKHVSTNNVNDISGENLMKEEVELTTVARYK